MTSLTDLGFTRDRLNEIKTKQDTLVTDALGSVNTNADSVIGQLNGIWAEGIDNVNEVLEDTYNAMYPSTAEGTSLDGAVSFVGLTRIPATETVVTGAAYGVEGTVILANSLAHADVQYKSTSDVTISRANALDVTIEVVTLANSTAYNIFAGGLSFTYTSDSSATKLEIATGIVALVNASSILVGELIGETFRIYSADLETPFAITVDIKLNITLRASPVVFVALEKGAIECPAGALVSIDSPVTGWDSLVNLKAGAPGRNTETDAELRLRHAKSVRATGSATVEAIRARMLQDVPEVTSIRIYENRTNITSVDGIPPHAFESVVVGGTDSDVLNQLWLTKPAGIETHGNESGLVIDSNGDAQTVKFSRSVPKYGWLNITVILYSEETIPESANLAIKEACYDYALLNIGVGTDIIIQRFIGAIFDAVSGIASINITAAITASPSDTPIYTSSNIAIGKAENAVFDISRISVIGV